MTIVNFTPVSALAGGALIGLSAAMLLLLTGRLAGVSGVLAGLLPPARGDAGWRLFFLAGLIAGAALFRLATGQSADVLVFEASWPVLVVGGLLAGAGTRVSGGCTSGHGVCGIGRLSPRSLVATPTFMVTGALAVYVSRHLLGG